MTGSSRVNRLRRPGTREWWLAYLTGPVLVVLLAVALFPRLIYDQFIWQYLWGPVVADAAGEPVVRRGVTATSGYTYVNTLVYVGIAVYVLFGLRTIQTSSEIDLDERLAFALVPFLVAGGAMRALADAAALGGYEVLFITPPIYVFVTGIAVGAIVIGTVLSRTWTISTPAFVAVVGSIWAIGAVGYAVRFAGTTTGTVRPWVPVATLGIAGLFTAGFYVLGRIGVAPAFTRPIYLLVAFGQLWDGAQNLVGAAVFGYEPKMVLTHHLYEVTGTSGSTFLLTLGLVPVVVWILADGEGEMDHGWWWLLVLAVIVVGLPMGVRGSLRMMLGV